MFGYEPPKPPPEPGSWGEIFEVVRVVFREIGKPLLAILGVLTLVLSTLFLFFTDPVYALVPLAILGGGVWWLVRRDRQAIRDAEDNLPR